MNKPVLEVKKKTVIEVEYHNFEQFIIAVYNIPAQKYYTWSVVADQEAGNNSVLSFDVSKKEPLDEFDQADIEKFTGSGQGQYMTQNLLQDLVNQDLIEPGEYLIDISW